MRLPARPYVRRSRRADPGGRADGCRRKLRPDGLAGRGGPWVGAPAGGQPGHQEQSPARLRVTGRLMDGRGRHLLGAGVRHLDAECLRRCGQPEVEVPAGDVAVSHRVGSEFGRDQGQGLVDGGVVRVPPLVESVRDGTPGETGTARGGGELHGELVRGGRDFRCLCGGGVRGFHGDELAEGNAGLTSENACTGWGCTGGCQVRTHRGGFSYEGTCGRSGDQPFITARSVTCAVRKLIAAARSGSGAPL